MSFFSNLKDFPALSEQDTEPLPPPLEAHSPKASPLGYFYGYIVFKGNYDVNNDEQCMRLFAVHQGLRNLAHVVTDRDTAMVYLAVYRTTDSTVWSMEGGNNRIPNARLRKKLEESLGVTEGPHWFPDDGSYFWYPDAVNRIIKCWSHTKMALLA
ncbi:hypothetical protein MIND_01191500 [Mycena indigotica]|uniref:Uncharacterized protein n=1 Tax=Mycena indigotica TaxID=2126181 RepID=A0A8H6VT38_9AGAR|nr:uncharacterized protein MIND_01191000 [Mycena indigotica]XP_037215352.1 uncharacterized protein MIND_01191500 [Mycena indigotica]KAF7292919.1 hypothetical protein MIND_01191000 [Mycena indigotica]KAF7292924.1 hypothetical protein MIND_01191500 [Mycena indigotica]